MIGVLLRVQGDDMVLAVAQLSSLPHRPCRQLVCYIVKMLFRRGACKTGGVVWHEEDMKRWQKKHTPPPILTEYDE